MNDQDMNLLDDYLNGILPAGEATAFRQRLETEPELARELALREQMDRWLKTRPDRAALTQNLQDIGAGYFTETAAKAPGSRIGTVSMGRRLLLAAAFIGVLVAAWFLLQPRDVSYEQFAMHQPLHLSERGNADVAAAEADAAFNAGDYARALPALDQLLAAEPDNGTARLYRGICLLELKRPAEARVALEPLATGQSALRADGIWYTALGYLQEKDMQRCKQYLQQLETGDAHFKEAQVLLKKID